MQSGEPRFLLVREDLLPDAVVKALRVKQLLAQRDNMTVYEAAEAVGISRSAFINIRTAYLN